MIVVLDFYDGLFCLIEFVLVIVVEWLVLF